MNPMVIDTERRMSSMRGGIGTTIMKMMPKVYTAFAGVAASNQVEPPSV